MDTSCKLQRIEWLNDGVDRVHAAGCASCAAWIRSAERQRAALTSLAHLSAPSELEFHVGAELAGDPSRRYERLFAGLSPLPAPAELGARVDAVLHGRVDDERLLRGLDHRRAPHVLERLLDEELAAPERARTERFTGSLERVLAPHVLERRIESAVRRRALARLIVRPLAMLAAAGLVVWVAVQRREPELRTRRFEVVQATSLDELTPMARQLAESLGGGVPQGSAR